ncbi:MAG: efflux RND transporter periplasmic adaptor subunit [Armatimonadetes bacterium]|nr:efflux RND transporter periplasmic adaptor subunit [Armatimonadota bacterium]
MRRWWPVVLAAVLIGGGVWFYRARAEDLRLPWQARAPRELGYRSTTVVRGDLVVAVAATGTVQPQAQVDVRSRATGRVIAVYVQEGEPVRKGQVLVQLEDPDARAQADAAVSAVQTARARLAQQEAAYQAMQSQSAAQIRQAQAAMDAARSRLAQLTAGSRPEEIAQAEEAVRSAEADVQLARQNVERVRQLFKDGFVSRQQLDQAEAQVKTSEAQLRSARARLTLVRMGPRSEEIETARAQLRQAEAQLAEARATALQLVTKTQEIAAAHAQLRSAEADLRAASQKLAETRITAPISGIVARRAVEVGTSVIGGLASSGTQVMLLADVTTLQAAVNVDEVDIARIRPQMEVDVTTQDLPGEKFTGTVLRVAPQSVVVNNVVQFPVTIRVDDPQRRLRLGMTVDASFIVARRLNALLVPAEAVKGKEVKAVLVVNGERLVPRVVEVGATDNTLTEIRRGLQEGEVVYLGPARGVQRPRPQQPTSPITPQFRPRTPPSRP